MAYEPPDWLVQAVSTIGGSAREQLSTGAGEPEEALRVPLITVEELTSAGVLPVPDSRRVLTSSAPTAEQDQLHYSRRL